MSSSLVLPSTPHSFPCRFVETVTCHASGTSSVVMATANGLTTGTGPWPVTLVAEAMAQSVLLVDPPDDMSALRLVGLDNVTVLRPPVSGDRLEVEVDAVAAMGRMRRYRCEGRCGGALAVTAEVTVSS